MVTQDTSLLHRSVRDNILYGRPDACEAEVIAAAKKAQAQDFILGLEDGRGRKGYDAHVGERGVKLSGGQRQRLCIARALACEPKVLIADEAVSALDVSVQEQILELLDDIQSRLQIGILFITHDLRVASQICNRLIVMHEGRIVEQGLARDVLLKPEQAYTRSLLAAAPGQNWTFSV